VSFGVLPPNIEFGGRPIADFVEFHGAKRELERRRFNFQVTFL
jgi:hypothetical protein